MGMTKTKYKVDFIPYEEATIREMETHEGYIEPHEGEWAICLIHRIEPHWIFRLDYYDYDYVLGDWILTE